MNTVISNGSLRVTVDTSGAQLRGIRSGDGTEYLWQGNPKYWADSAPILFPFTGRSTKGIYTCRGKEYPMALHGFAAGQEFSVISRENDSIILRLESSPETKACYPFDFSLTVGYRLSGNTLSVSFTVENLSGEVMPFAIGGHPGFNVPLCEGESFEDYSLTFSEPCEPVRIGFSPTCFLSGDDKPYPLAGGDTLPLMHSLFDDDAIFLRNTSAGITLNGPKGKGVTVSFPGLQYIGFWHCPKTDAPYVCIEPWSSLPARQDVVEELTEKEDLIRLQPGGRQAFIWSINIM